MFDRRRSTPRIFRLAPASVLLLCYASNGIADDAPIIQPGAPGEPVRELSAEEAVRIADSRFSPADVRFMQDMIPHHNQAVVMSELVADRTNLPALVDLAGRINASQADEIEFMQSWLVGHGEQAPDPFAHAAMHTTHKMAGMASPQQMAELAGAEGTAFDQLFLTLMIAHHQGAVKMVEELLQQPGSAYDPLLLEFTTNISNDQTSEIERMNALLLGLSADPRAGLSAGFTDAGQAIRNLRLVATLAKPPGFVDPANPAEMPPLMPDEDAEKAKPTERAPLLVFGSTDLAFSRDILVAGNYHGFNIYKLHDDGVPVLHSSVVCPGGQGDVSVVGDLLFMSVEDSRARIDCGLGGVDDDVSDERFLGLRIFDISDLARPKQVGQVQTCRGSHTHSVVSGPGDDGKIIVYNSGTSAVRDKDELAGCFDETPGDDRTALFRIDVIEIPVDDPSKARIVDSPAVFADPESGSLAGLWRGGDHGDDTQDSDVTDQCHDITTFPELGIAGGACAGNGILFDISDPLHPQRMDVVVDEGFRYWHSATFNNDGSKVLFTDEWGGGSYARCRTYDPRTWGADAIYDIVDGTLEFRSYYKLPAPQTEQENCVAHNGSIIPVPGRDIFVQAWYQGGVSIIDFTDSANPLEIAYFDRGPINADHLVWGGYWSVYWYHGKIYGTESTRGLDVLALLPSEYLSENEIAAAQLADQGERFNPQQQFAVTWPAEAVVARAYSDQLNRAGVLPETLSADLDQALVDVAHRLASGTVDKKLARKLESMAAAILKLAGTPATAGQRSGLARTLKEIAARLR